MEPGCIGKSNTNNLPGPTDVTKNPYGKKTLFLKLQVKNWLAWYNGEWGIALEFVPREPIFEKCSHLREKGGVLTKIWNSRNRLSRTVLGNIRYTNAYVTNCTSINMITKICQTEYPKNNTVNHRVGFSNGNI